MLDLKCIITAAVSERKTLSVLTTELCGVIFERRYCSVCAQWCSRTSSWLLLLYNIGVMYICFLSFVFMMVSVGSWNKDDVTIFVT